MEFFNIIRVPLAQLCEQHSTRRHFCWQCCGVAHASSSRSGAAGAVVAAAAAAAAGGNSRRCSPANARAKMSAAALVRKAGATSQMSHSIAPQPQSSPHADDVHGPIIKEIRKLDRTLKDVRVCIPSNPSPPLTRVCRSPASSRSRRPAPRCSQTKKPKLRAKTQCGSRCLLCSSSILKQLPSLQLY